VLPDKDSPRRCGKRYEQQQYGVALKSEQIWLGFIQSNIDLWELTVPDLSRQLPILAACLPGGSKSIVCTSFGVNSGCLFRFTTKSGHKFSPHNF
jgi:hypothetical protein